MTINIELQRLLKLICSAEELTEVAIIGFLGESIKRSGVLLAYSVSESAFYHYTDELKYWKQEQPAYIESAIWKGIIKVLSEIGEPKKDIISRTDKENRKRMDARFKIFEGMTFKRIRDLVKSIGGALDDMPDVKFARYIPLLNGYVDLSTNGLEFKPTDPFIFNRYVLPFSYKENLGYPTLFNKFLAQIQPNEEHREFLINWLAYLLVPMNPRQKALFMLGDGRNGKGVITRIMTRILGEQNTTALSTSQLNSEQYHMATLHNKLANFTPDSDANEQIHIGTFKATTGGDRQTVRMIQGKPFELQFMGKLIFSVNRVPYFSAKDFAILRRVEILQFPASIKDQDVIADLEEKILEDGGDALFMFFLERARELAKIEYKFDAPKDVIEFSASVLDEKDSVWLFLEEFLSSETDGNKDIHQIAKRGAELYAEYKTYCADNGYKVPNSATFKENVIATVKKRKDWECETKHRNTGAFYVFTRSVEVSIRDDGMLLDKDGKELF